MLKNKLTGLDKKKLRRWLLLFFLALAIPAVLLIQQSYSRLKWEAFHQHQVLADELANRIDNQFLRLIETEEQRSFTDYSFLNIAGNAKNNLLQRSPLSKFPIESKIPGLIGYFQVDSKGQLMTPLLPESIQPEASVGRYGIDSAEFTARMQLQTQIQNILSQNSLVKNVPASQKILKKKSKLTENKKEQEESFLGKVFKSNNAMRSSKTSSVEYQSDSALGAPIVDEESNDSNNIQAGFDQLKQDFKQTVPQQKRVAKAKLKKQARIEQNILPETEALNGLYEKKTRLPKLTKPIKSKRLGINGDKTANFKAPKVTKVKEPQEKLAVAKKIAKTTVTSSNSPLKIRTFESAIDPFEFSQLNSGHFVLFRNVWLNDKRYIQGLLIDQKPFLENVINTAFRNTSLSQMSELLVSYQGDVLSVFSSQKEDSSSQKNQLSGELLHQARLSDPLSDLQLRFSVKQLPIGAGGKIILWLSLLLGSVLCAGFYLMYRLGLGQINLANQQQDFVSAVSHELKTPLTSIRMYSEILREGWANDEKKKTYYDFIFDESERLSRLINNVLHLARVTRNKQTAEMKVTSVAKLIDGVQSKVSTQIKHAGFEFNLSCDDTAKDASIEVDEDWFIQTMINLVDNAIKFSAKSEKKKIDLSCETNKQNIVFKIRDYGPGVDKAQMKKIFDLFYRTESELTRETVGTGIGLSLVHQMVVSMDGKIDVVNSEPGAEFRIVFAVADISE